MLGKRWVWGGVLVVVGMVVGAGLLLASVEINRLTSTEEFCGSCHSMTHVVADRHYQQSVHHANAQGVRVGCGDCHIPTTNWFTETYVHVSSGIRDVIAETTNDYADPAKWEARRVELAHEVREEMRRSDSVTCRQCHNVQAVAPESERGRAAHVLAREGRMTCIDCHFNLVHAPVPPTMSFVRGSGIRNTAAK